MLHSNNTNTNNTNPLNPINTLTTDLANSIGVGAFFDGYSIPELLVDLGSIYRSAQAEHPFITSPSMFKRAVLDGYNSAELCGEPL
jgi:hypothetical protein